MNLGISGHVAHFNSWSIEWYNEFEIEDFDSLRGHIFSNLYLLK